MTTILILQDNAYMACGIETIIDARYVAECVVAYVIPEALDAIADLPIDCAIVDNGAHPGSIAALRASTPVICLPLKCTPETLDNAIGNKAMGYVHKYDTPTFLIQTIDLVTRGGNALYRGRIRNIRNQIAMERMSILTPYSLAPREEEVLLLMADGYPNASIATTMGIREGSVRGYQRIIYDKLSVRNRAAALLLMARLGVI